MSYTNSTPNYALPQWIGTDKPTFLGDFNSAFSEIDTQMKANADASTAATATANTAAATATSANTNATTALNTANSAASEAASATSAAASATSTANNAATDASEALRASAANTIENLAPAYDPTLTYSVGDLVTYIDDQNSGRLYKCIVAVTSPMEFNINYWDDVSASDVFVGKSKIVSQITIDSTLTAYTWQNLLNLLASNVTFTVGKDYLLILEDSSSSAIHRCTYVSPDAISTANFVYKYSESGFMLEEMYISPTSSSFLDTLVKNDGTIVHSSKSNAANNLAIGRKIMIIEKNY